MDKEYKLIERTIRQTWGTPDLIVMPYLVIGGADAKWFAASGLTKNAYRFTADALNRRLIPPGGTGSTNACSSASTRSPSASSISSLRTPRDSSQSRSQDHIHQIDPLRR